MSDKPFQQLARMAEPKVVVTHGYLGWANPDNNPLHSLSAYGPRGRWHGQRGDVLGDHLSEEGMAEGAPIIVIASSSRFDLGLFEEMRSDVAQFVADWLTVRRAASGSEPGDQT